MELNYEAVKDILFDQTMSCSEGEAISYLRQVANGREYGWSNTDSFKYRELRKKVAKDMLKEIFNIEVK